MFSRRELLGVAAYGLVVFSMMTFLAVGAQAEVVIDYSAGDGAPGSVGWAIVTAGTACTGSLVDDAGTPAFYTKDPTTASSNYYSVRGEAALTAAQSQEAVDVGFSMSATLRAEDMIADGFDEAAGPAPGFTVAMLDLGVWYVFGLGQDANGDTTYLLKGGKNLADVSTGTISGDGYHTYELLYSSEAGSADLLIDGTEVISDVVSSTTIASALGNRIRWGVEDSPGIGAGYWSDVSFETAPASLLVPEPSTLLLLLMAAGSLLAWKRSH